MRKLPFFAVVKANIDSLFGTIQGKNVYVQNGPGKKAIAIPKSKNPYIILLYPLNFAASERKHLLKLKTHCLNYNRRYCLNAFKCQNYVFHYPVTRNNVSEKLGLCSRYFILRYETSSYVRITNIISSCTKNYLYYYDIDEVGDAAVVFRAYFVYVSINFDF